MEAVDAVRRRLAVEVPAGEVAAEIENAYAQLRRSARVKGFRPGRAPRSVLERSFGDQVRADVFGKLIQSSYLEALEAQHIAPVSQPEIVTEQAEPGGPLRYSATVEVKPEVVVSGYAGLDAERPLRPVAEADIDEFLARLRDSLAQLRPLTDRAEAQVGDVALVDYEARADQRLIGRGENRLVEVGAGTGPDALGTHLVGVAVGSACRFEVDYPADHPNRDVAGRHVVITAQVKNLALKEVPTLDDDFAKDHGECATLAELRERVRGRLAAEAAHEADRAVRGALMQQLVQAHEVQAPHAMVDRRVESLVDDFLDRLGQRQPPASQVAELRARLRSDLEPRAREQIKAELILEALARQERLDIPDADIDGEIERFAERAGNASERVRALYQDPAARDGLRAQLLQERALDLVVARANIRTVERKSSVAEPGVTG